MLEGEHTFFLLPIVYLVKTFCKKYDEKYLVLDKKSPFFSLPEQCQEKWHKIKNVPYHI